jgi:hypothetical protein
VNFGQRVFLWPSISGELNQCKKVHIICNDLISSYCLFLKHNMLFSGEICFIKRNLDVKCSCLVFGG